MGKDEKFLQNLSSYLFIITIIGGVGGLIGLIYLIIAVVRNSITGWAILGYCLGMIVFGVVMWINLRILDILISHEHIINEFYENETESQNEDFENVSICPKCGNQIFEDDEKCSNCGWEIED